MDMAIALLAQQFVDPFRIGLLLFLVLTTYRTSAQTGILVPLVLGVGFVAVLLATSFPRQGSPWALQVGVGLVVNTVIAGVMVGLVTLWRRARERAAR